MKIRMNVSLFAKLLAVYAGTLLIIAAGGIAFRLISSGSGEEDISRTNLLYFSQLIAEKIGTPPDERIVKEVEVSTGLEISISGPGLPQTDPQRTGSDGDADDYGLLGFLPVFGSAGLGETPVEIVSGDYTFRFMDFHADPRVTTMSWVVLTAFVLAAIAFNYFFVRELLKPLKKMSWVAGEFGASDWSHRVRPSGNDELSTLGFAMDAMADRIERYVASMHDLLSAVSHEFRSPLTRMKVELEFIEDEKIRNSLNEEIDVLDRLTGNLLEQKRLSSQPDILRRRMTDIPELTASVLRPFTDKGLDIRLETEGGEALASVDGERYELALRNLIENAQKYATGSPVRVILKMNEHDCFSLTVEDEGKGVPENMLPDIGRAFLTADSSRTGTRTHGGFGLGLSIVKAVAEAHGGTIEAKNGKPSGFSLTLEFPRY